MERTQLLLKFGNALHATDEVREWNGVGFNKPDWAQWPMVAGDDDAMACLLYKYKRQLAARFGEEQVEAAGLAEMPEALERAKQAYRLKREQEAEARRAAQNFIQFEQLGEQHRAVIRGRIDRDQFGSYISAIKAIGGRYDGVGMVLPKTANFAAFGERMRALGLRVAGFSCLTNLAAGLGAHPLSHGEVLETGRRAADDFARLLEAALPEIASGGG